MKLISVTSLFNKRAYLYVLFFRGLSGDFSGVVEIFEVEGTSNMMTAQT